MASITAENVVPLSTRLGGFRSSSRPFPPYFGPLRQMSGSPLSLSLIKQYIYFRRNMWLALSQQKTICGAKEGERVDVIVGASTSTGFKFPPSSSVPGEDCEVVTYI